MFLSPPFYGLSWSWTEWQHIRLCPFWVFLSFFRMKDLCRFCLGHFLWVGKRLSCQVFHLIFELWLHHSLWLNRCVWMSASRVRLGRRLGHSFLLLILCLHLLLNVCICCRHNRQLLMLYFRYVRCCVQVEMCACICLFFERPRPFKFSIFKVFFVISSLESFQ